MISKDVTVFYEAGGIDWYQYNSWLEAVHAEYGFPTHYETAYGAMRRASRGARRVWEEWYFSTFMNWWAHESEEIVDEYRYWRARPPHASRTRDAVDGYAFAAAWERSDR